jgi:LysM repeat protein
MNSRTHVVATGETLIGIARRHGVTLKALLAANPSVKDPNRIRVGQSLAVPAGRLIVPEPALVLPGSLPGALPLNVPMPRLPAEDERAFAAMDKRNKAKALHPVFRERLVMLAGVLARRGMAALITDGLRTFEEQDALFAKGRRGIAGEKKVTNARGGQSNHNYGLAVDMYPVLPDSSGHEKVFTTVPPGASVEFARAFNETQHAVGEESEQLGLFWGARFMGIVDTPHVQLLAQHEMSPKECLDIYRRNGETLRAVWDEASRRVRPLAR